jgi:hypothetical protein
MMGSESIQRVYFQKAFSPEPHIAREYNIVCFEFLSGPGLQK